MQTRGTDANIITSLRNLTWRNLEAPGYSDINASGGFDRATREYPNVPAKAHTNMGRSAIPFTFVLMFRNTLAPGSFPDHFDKWYEAVALDPTIDVLRHPVLGPMTAVVTEWSFEFTASRTDGPDLTVSWEESQEPGDNRNPELDVIDIVGEAAAADAAMTSLGIDYPTGKRTTSLTDLIGQVQGFVFSTRLTLEGIVNQALGIINSLIATTEKLVAHVKWVLLDLLKSLYKGLKDLVIDRNKDGRKTAEFITPADDTLDSIADAVGNTAGEVATLNSSVLGKPLIPAGTTISYYVD